MSSTNRDINKVAMEALRFSRAYCSEYLPWFSRAIFKCKIKLTDQVNIAAIDQQLNIYFNPKLIASLYTKYEKRDALSQIGFLWIHEISHILRDHAKRASELKQEYFPLIWNIAADCEINDSNWNGLSRPKDFPGLHPKQFSLASGDIAEIYYEKLIKQKKQQFNFLDEGSGVHNEKRPWEKYDKTKITTIDLEIIKHQVATDMKKHLIGDKRNFGGWSRWIKETLEPSVDWKKVLKHKLGIVINKSIMGKLDYSFNQISRRQSIYRPIYLPSLKGDSIPKITVLLKTSTTIEDHQLQQGIAEICSLLETFRLPVQVIPFGPKAYSPIHIKSKKDFLKLQRLPTGCGTELLTAIESVLKLRPTPDAILVLTTSLDNIPKQKSKTPLIFGVIKEEGYPINIPSSFPIKHYPVVRIPIKNSLTK